jgi:hypothetical protein
MRDKIHPTQIDELHPNQIVRFRDGPKFFGLKHTQLQEAIDRGEIEEPFALTDSGRAKGWTGAQILEHHRKRIEASKREAEAKRATVAA